MKRYDGFKSTSKKCTPNGAANCLASNIKSVAACQQDPACPVPGDNIAPWVKVSFEKAKDGIIKTPIITVGNRSSVEFRHYPAIKSMEYGVIDGHKMKIEIVDQKGGAFGAFADALLKCMEHANDEYTMKVQWGWNALFCDRDWHTPVAYLPKFVMDPDDSQRRMFNAGATGYNRQEPWEASPVITFLPINMEVDFSAGVVKYTITGTDFIQPAMHTRIKRVFGKDPELVRPLKEAIVDLGREPPVGFEVEFLRKDGTPWEFEGGKEWPTARWNSDGEFKLAIIQRWIEPYLTDDFKGITCAWDTGNPKGTLILWEDPSLGCKEQMRCEDVVDTFVVNGGQCSPVISFNPNINWIAAFGTMAGGGAVSHANGVSHQRTTKRRRCEIMQDLKENNSANMGTQAYIFTNHGTLLNYEDKERLQKTADAQNEHGKANSPREGIQPVEAELKIQGNPAAQYCDAATIQGRFVSLAVVNPFHLGEGSGETPCGDWLVKPQLQKVLTNKYWRLIGVNHNIKEGSYITTLKLKLDTPGIDIEPEARMGGDDSPHAWKPANTC